ncbi:MAG: aminotransferase class III-fold pyridoxal phosphate-dependent enzyme [Candidatus Promineifilaceae bacterium]
MVSTEFIKEHNGKHIVHPMSHVGNLSKNVPMIISSADGVRITDIDGHSMVDGVGGLWNVNVGYNRPEIKQAINAQLDKLHYYSIFGGVSNDVVIELSEKLVGMMQPEKMARAFFSSGGSDAVETALRLARLYWKAEGQRDRTKFISLRGGYHGTHFGGASVNGNTVFRRNFEPMLPGCFHVEAPYLYRNQYTNDHEELGRLCAQMLENEIVFQGPDTVAAFIAEPVQGAGGVIVPPANYWPLLRAVCDKYDVLLISDEVVTGFGRTGSMFGARAWGVAPDMMTLAKGINSGYIPLGATMINDRISHALETNQDSFGAVMHGYTYSGHPVACAAAIANLDIVQNEALPAAAGLRGDYFLSKLKPFIERFKSVGDVRGKGLMVALEMVSDKATKTPMIPEFGQQIAQIARKEGAMVRSSGPKIILSPPLVINEEELDVIVNALDIAFSELDR